MIAAILCLAVLLMLPSDSLARPLRRVAAPPSCSLDQQSMPDLNGLILRSSPRVVAKGRLIKGLYYSDSLNGSYNLVAFFIACDRLLEPKPFLVMDFRTHQFSFDGDRDGCADEIGLLSPPDIDPADFLPAVERGEEICDEKAISQRWPKGLVAVQETTVRRVLPMPR